MKLWPFTRKDPTGEFWRWFEANRDRLHSLHLDESGLVDALRDRLHAIEPGLVYEFTVEGGRAVEFVISADGDKKLFPQVIAAVKAAPEIPGWKITAFRQPGNPDVAIEMSSGELAARDLRFQAGRDGERVGLTIFIPGLTRQNEESMAKMVFILLDNALGEFLVETSLGYLRFAPLPEDTSAEELLPFVSVLEHVSQVVH